MVREKVVVTIGQTDEGLTSHEVEPGETFSKVVGDAYIEVVAPEPPDGLEVEYVSTDEQDETSAQSDREWKVETVKCVKCGTDYPDDYDRCHECGEPNQKLEDLES